MKSEPFFVLGMDGETQNLRRRFYKIKQDWRSMKAYGARSSVLWYGNYDWFLKHGKHLSPWPWKPKWAKHSAAFGRVYMEDEGLSLDKISERDLKFQERVNISAYEKSPCTASTVPLSGEQDVHFCGIQQLRVYCCFEVIGFCKHVFKWTL